ncbi:MAG TPA: hypothetical protein VJ741_17435 [Solirubrobacteraceae bacterium]|nr:hypothetical protein [Solirubrobacteraceae bacterium]
MPSTLLPLTRRDPERALHDTLSKNVVFHSPVRDYYGRADVAHILMTIGDVLDEIEPQGELVGENQVVTVITARRAHARMSGVLLETCDTRGRVEHATLLLRPLSALLEALTAMRAALERSPLPTAADSTDVNQADPEDDLSTAPEGAELNGASHADWFPERR